MYEYLQITLHYDFENFIELISGEAFDVLGAGVEVATNGASTARWALTEAVSPSKISR